MSVYCCLFHYDSVQKLLDPPSYLINLTYGWVYLQVGWVDCYYPAQP